MATRISAKYHLYDLSAASAAAIGHTLVAAPDNGEQTTAVAIRSFSGDRDD